MLVLSRKQNETIVIPSLGVTVRVVALGRGRVRLGIEAPREVAIARHEMLVDRSKIDSQSRSGEHLVGVA